MNVHKNARLTRHSRAELVRRVLEAGQSHKAVAQAFGVSEKTARKWVNRFRAEGPTGLMDRSSRPHLLRKPTPIHIAEQIEALRRRRITGKPIGNPYDSIGWHCDHAAGKNATEYTVLYGLEVPEVGGATCFASMYKAYEALPDERKHAIGGLEMITAYEKQYTTRIFLADKGVTDHPYDQPLTAEQMESARVRHKRRMLSINPYNGRKWLHLVTMGCVGVDGMEDEDGISLVEGLVEFATSEPFRYDHAWRAGDLVIWDNRGLFHVAGEWDKVKYRRHIWRCSIGAA